MAGGREAHRAGRRHHRSRPEAGQPIRAMSTARVKDAEDAPKKSVLLFVAKGGKQSEMRFIAVRIKK